MENFEIDIKKFDLSALYMYCINNQNIYYDEDQYSVIKRINLAINNVLKEKKIIFLMKKFFKTKAKKVFYLYGSVGSGKSFITNLVFKSFPENSSKKKIRLTFYDLINELRDQVNSTINNDNENTDSIVRNTIKRRFAKVELLCIDEFHILDISDAMLIGEFLKIIFKNSQIIILINSNRHPDDLYKDGIHKERFIPILELIKKYSDIIPLSTKDYRNYLKGAPKNYYVFLENEQIKNSDDLLQKFLEDNYHKVENHEVKILSQRIKFILNTHFTYKVAYFEFHELFNRPLYAQNYQELITKFSLRKIFINNIPKFNGHDDWAKRFIAFIDVAYENKVYLILSSFFGINDLYIKGKMLFEFNRTISRMNSLCQ